MGWHREICGVTRDLASACPPRAPAVAFGFLVGPSQVNLRSDGELGGLVVTKCKFLQESNCKGMCLNSCKLPAQQVRAHAAAATCGGVCLPVSSCARGLSPMLSLVSWEVVASRKHAAQHAHRQRSTRARGPVGRAHHGGHARHSPRVPPVHSSSTSWGCRCACCPTSRARSASGLLASRRRRPQTTRRGPRAASSAAARVLR
eukprot:7387402-Prymnesium_polylepis.2